MSIYNNQEPILILKKENRILLLIIVIIFLILTLVYRFNKKEDFSNGTPFSVLPIGNSEERFVINDQEIKTPFESDPVVIDSTVKIVSNIKTFKFLVNGKNFKSFKYDDSGSQILGISDKCLSTYYTILIFNTKDNYVKNPNTSKYNKAFLCPSSKNFYKEIDVESLNLINDETYYVVVADQGGEGSWYNPR